jgi:8-oxo-dGTP pyrophosphatase MutT (NUDIX family)
MHRQSILRYLSAYHPEDTYEKKMHDQIQNFVRTHPRCFERTLLEGHLTGSAWILDRERAHALMTHHAKLDRWLQLGGHADGEPDILSVALREAREESGLDGIRTVSDLIFDVDIHEIPARKDEPKHFHYDIRFLCEADRNDPLTISGESRNLKWIALEEMSAYTTEESMLRMVRKSFQLTETGGRAKSG